MNDSYRRLRFMAGCSAIVGLVIAATTVASCTADDELRAVDYVNRPSGVFGGSMGGSGTPCVNGTKVECHETVGTNEGILTCLHGEQTCVNGSWGPCAGAYSARTGWERPEAAPVNPDEVRILGFSDAGPCQNNPCDPYCQDYEEVPPADAGYQVVPTIESVYYTGSLADALALTPSGFVQKGMKAPCSSTMDCQFDTHCLPTGTQGIECGVGVTKCCMPWRALEYDASCNRPDPTTGFACTQTVNGQKVPLIPVCNRGSVVLDPPVRIYIFPGNSPQYPLCVPDKDPYVCDTAVPVYPGQCINVAGCPGLSGNGTKSIMINGPKNGGGGQAPNNPNWVNECTCENNWGVWSGNNAPCHENANYSATPVIKNQTYQAVCPSGTRPLWQYLTWDTSTPLDSNVIWEGRVATTNAELSSASYFSLGIARATPAPDTHLCGMGGPSGCPINLFNTFGGSPIANSEFLELRITLQPSSDKTKGAAVNNWQVSYSCPPAQ